MNRPDTEERARESGDATRSWRPPAGFWIMLAASALTLAFTAPSTWFGFPAASVQVGSASFHHIHLNVTDPDSTRAFYERFFGAYPVQYRDRSPALFTERSFILLNQVPEKPPSNVGTALYHVGWSGVVGPAEFEWRVQDGIEVETPATPLGTYHYMYFWGPDRELIEIYTGNRNHRFEHLHLVVPNQRETSEWFQRHLGISSLGAGGTALGVDNINLIITEIAGPDAPNRPVWYPEAQYPEDIEVRPTDGTAIDHIAFSYPELDPVFDRMTRDGVEIVHPIRVDADHGHRSFFVRGPDGLLIEIVEDWPIPEGLWAGRGGTLD